MTKKTKHCSFCNKSSSEVKKLVAGPKTTEQTVYICNECIDIGYNAIHRSSTTTIENYSPSAIKKALDLYVIGQEESKKSLSVAVYNHIKRINNPVVNDTTLTKQNVLMVGPSGTGKTLLVSTLSKIIDVPFIHVDATVYTESGYVGEDVTSIIGKLLEECDWDIEATQKGIVYIDEIDKKCKRNVSSSSGKDVSGEGVQQSLLKMVEGTQVKVQKNHNETVEVDTTNILFIAGGAFTELHTQNNKASIGFQDDIRQKEQLIDSERLIEYGLIPEFIGRFPVITVLKSLDISMLIDIITKPRNCIVDQYKSLFLLDDINLIFSEEYIERIAMETLKKNTGARSIHNLIDRDLLDVQFSLPELKQNGIEQIVINQDGKPNLTKVKINE